jgi:hypothetical protein
VSAWYVDHGLAVLIEQWKAAHPGATVYTIGDAAHASEASDHNPDPDGSVDAADFMLAGPVGRADLDKLAEALRVGRDHRIKYVIWSHHIFSSTVAPWAWRGYTGSDPHTGHVHVSVNDAHSNDTSPWAGVDDMSDVIKGIQEALKAAGYDPGAVDGAWGPKTAAALVAAFKKTGPAGPPGLPGKDGKPGRDGAPGKTPTEVSITGTGKVTGTA